MTENKRFLIDDAGELIDLNNHKFIDYGDECCKVLNELYEENEQLKRSVQYWYDEHKRIVNNYVDKIKEVEKENGQLRKENDMLSCELSVSANKEISRNCRIAELEEENEQLKQFQEQANEFHRGARENANIIGQLKRENKKLKEENENLKQALWEAEEGYLYEVYHDPIRLQDKLINLKEDWDKEYWND